MKKGGSDEPPQIPTPYGPGDTVNMRGFLQSRLTIVSREAKKKQAVRDE